MAKKVSQLTTAGTLQADDVMPVVQSGVTKKTSFSQLNSNSGLTAHLANTDIHAALDDSSSANDELWSAAKIIEELNLKAATSHGHALTDAGITGTLPLTKGGLGFNTLSALQLVGAQVANTPIGVALGSTLQMVSSILGVVPDTVRQLTGFSLNGTLVSNRSIINFVDGGGATFAVTDDAANNRALISLLVASPSLGYVVLQDQKTSGTEGGTFTSGAERTRVLNTKVFDNGSNCTLAANQFVLTAGSWVIIAIAPALFCASHRIILRNVTAGTTLITGASAENNTVTTSNSAFLIGGFTVAAAQSLELQHRCGTTRATDGFGGAHGFGTEVYSQVFLVKVA